MEQYKIAVLSTGHLPPPEASDIERTPAQDFPFVIAPFEDGWFVSCHSARCPETAPGHGPYAAGRWPALQQIREWAAANGFEYVMLDRDAEEVDGLPTYEWP